MSTRPIVAGALMAAAIVLPAGVSARPRPRFEPTDLEWEETGVAEVDLEFGAIRSPGPWRFVIPDFEIDFGIYHNVELDLDGAYAIEGPDTGAFSFDHAVPDSLWPSLKIGIWNDHDYETRRAQAVGIQLGPKLPVAHLSHGIGAEGLLVLGGSVQGVNAVLNLGGFIEPAQDGVTLPPDSVSRRASISRCSWMHRTGSSGPPSWRRRTSSRRIRTNCTRRRASPGRRRRTWTFRLSACSASSQATTATASFSASSRNCACSRWRPRRRTMVSRTRD